MVQVNDTAIKFTLPTQFPQTMLSYLASVREPYLVDHSLQLLPEPTSCAWLQKTGMSSVAVCVCVCVCVCFNTVNLAYAKPFHIYKDYCVPSHSQTETLGERVW